MDAADLDALLQDVREYMVFVRAGDRQYIEQLTNVAREKKMAAKGIGHIIEQHLLRTDPAHKIGAFLLIDSITQNVGEPYVSYFSKNFAQMFLEVWKHAGPSTRDRMRRWLEHYRDKRVFPQAVTDAIQASIDPGTAQPAQQAPPGGRRRDPRDPRRHVNHMSGHAAPPVPAGPGGFQPHPYGQPAALQSHAWQRPPGPFGQLRPPMSPYPGGLMANGDGAGPRPPPAGFMNPSYGPMTHAAPLGTSFAGVNLQDFRQDALLFINEVTRKIRTHLNDKRILRERSRREKSSFATRLWYAPADMWIRGTISLDTVAPERADLSQKKAQVEEKRYFVIKDESQPRCAICNEQFTEEWNEELQEWVYMDAVRLPAEIAELPEIGLKAGSIVKVGLLEPEACNLLDEFNSKVPTTLGKRQATEDVRSVAVKVQKIW